MIEKLHRLVFTDLECRSAIVAGLHRAAERLSDPQNCGSYASVTLPIGLFSKELPETLRGQVRLCRVFAIQANQRAPHEEIHRNSTQRLVSFKGIGVVNCAKPGGVDRSYTPHQISSPDLAVASDISSCWDVVPENTWHFPAARGAGQWYGVAFHSASAEQIAEEYEHCE